MPPLVKRLKERSVILVRHGETAMNEKDVARGWTDVPLSEDSYALLKATGVSLKKHGVQGIASSDLLRTLQTAHFLSRESGIPILKIGNFLHTWNIGKYTGKSAKKVDPILEQIAKDDPYETIEGGESFEEFKYRFLLGLVSLLNEHQGKLIACATHGRNLAILNAWAQYDYNDDLELSPDHLGYEDYEPATAHLFTIASPLLV